MKGLLFILSLIGTSAALYAYRDNLKNIIVDPRIRGYVNPGPLSPGHTQLNDKCEACHAPYRGVISEGCILCHANNQQLLQRQPTAFHATIGECSACHFEHTKQDRRPIQMDHSALARIGTKMVKSLLAEKPSPESFFARIAAAAKSPAPDQSLNCASCHSIEDKHVGLFGSECSACHQTTSWKIPGYRHPPESSLDCAQCHQAPPSHYMEHFHMVSERIARVEHAKVNQRYLCHRTTVWNDIRGVGYYKHH